MNVIPTSAFIISVSGYFIHLPIVSWLSHIAALNFIGASESTTLQTSGPLTISQTFFVVNSWLLKHKLVKVLDDHYVFI